MSKKEEKEINNKENNESEDSSESSEGSIEVNSLTIKKETLKSISIDIDSYEKLIAFLQDMVNTNKILKEKLNKTYLDETIQTEKINILEENKNEIDENKNLIKELEDKNKDLTEKLKEIQKENEKNLKEIEQLKLDLKKLNDINLNKIIKLETEKNNLQNELRKLKENGQKNILREIYSNPKLLNEITKYLKYEDKISLSKTNSKLWHELYFKTKFEVMEKRIKKKEEIINQLSKEDINTKFKVNEGEIEDLLKEYLIGDKISGKEIRNEIVNSLIFLTKYVKNPLNNFKNPTPKIENEKQEKISFFSKNTKGNLFGKLSSFVSVIKGEEEENENNNNEEKDKININNYQIIKFSNEEFKNLFEADRHILETINNDKTINIKFEYEKPENIKHLLDEFFKCQLPKPSYQKFLVKICEVFSNLLYACYCGLKDIKNLEIIKYTLYCRYMKFKIKIEEMNSEIQDLNQFAESSKEIKEMLLKQKNDVDIKYNNSLMMITQLNDEKSLIQKKNNELQEELKNSSKKFDEFKNQISNEYQKIKNEFELSKKEKDLLKGTLLDFKNYFMKFIGNDGEIIEK